MNATYRLSRILIALVAGVCLLGGALLLRGRAQAVSAELSPLETRVLGQSRWLAGGPASLRVIVTDHRTGTPQRADVKLTLTRKVDKEQSTTFSLFTGATNQLGTLDAQFTAPKATPGSYQLTIDVRCGLGADTITQTVTLEDAALIMLTTDKPLYQPGQTMHLRALALDKATRAAVADAKITFEAEDARGNKVFKKSGTLSRFGVASTDFTLADEVNMGTYTLRAILPSGNVEKKVRVERYVLPKYKLAVTTDKPYYLPGDTVRGTVQADYFFGKPVANGDVTIEVSTVDIGVNQLAELTGTTDANGAYRFEYELPGSFIGQPFEQGKAVVEFHGIVVDAAQHMQDAHVSVPVVKEPIILVIVPECRRLMAGVPNRVFVAAATPDGSPLPNARLTVTNTETRLVNTLATDAMGLATYEFTPRAATGIGISVNAVAADGKAASAGYTYDAPDGDAVMLRVDRPLAKVGDMLTLSTLSTTRRGTVYLDVIRNGQTILTRAMEVDNGRADLRLPVTHDMTGTVTLHAYRILPNEEIIRDTRLVIVSPANDLSISVRADKPSYRPGEDAVLTFNVRDAQQHPILAAVGVAIVDESVFALSEMKPGLEKIYFMLEKELMEPKYEIHGLTPERIVLPPTVPGGVLKENEAARQRAAQVLFAAVDQPDAFDIRVNTYQERWEKMKSEVVEEMAKEHQAILAAVQKYRQRAGTALRAEQSLFELTRRGYLKLDDLRDRWGRFYRTNLHGNDTYEGWFTLNSAGPDGKWDTVDDITDVTMWRTRRFKDEMMEGDGMGPVLMRNAAMPMPMAAPAAGGIMFDMAAEAKATSAPTSQAAAGAEPVRIREYFPETMYWNPAIITDERGMATLRIPMADSITTWRMSMLANSASGQLGSADAPLRVFQDFFVDIDLPLSLTQHDRVEIPVAVYNYLPEAQTVTLTLEACDWFTLEGESVKSVVMGKDAVSVVHFPITVTKIGRFPLTVQARGTKLSDAIRRSIDVMPDGKEFRAAINDRLEPVAATSSAHPTKVMTIPAAAIDGASTIWVKLYPGTFSQVVEGLDGILRMPGGCFEQTSSTTYPNILVLSYLKQTKKVNPELQMKAEGYINAGYQRLVTFECKNGGFSWFGDEPANQVLTAYGLLEFSDMAKVHEVDANLIARTQQWLAGRQQADGTWKPDAGGIAEGIINRQTGALRATAYLAWALAESGYRGPQVDKAVQYVKAHKSEAKDAYTQAVILNLLTLVDRNGGATEEVANALIKLATVTDKTAYWKTETQTFTGARAEGADLETSGLATFALVKWGRNAGFTTKALTHLITSKDSFGTWSSTQGTVWSLKALLLASGSGVGGGGKGRVSVYLNGTLIKEFAITPEDSDVMRQVDLGTGVREGDNSIGLRYEGEGSLLYQIVGRYYIPWDQVAHMPEATTPLAIKVKYDKTTLAQHDTATVTVTVTNLTDKTAEMPLIDLGIPPGFTLQTEGLDKAVADKKISKYTQAARQVIVYIEKLTPGQSLTLTYGLKAKYPIKARTPQSTAYPYYNPEQVAVSAPQNVLVK